MNKSYRCPECDGNHECSGARLDCLRHWKMRAIEAENKLLVEKCYGSTALRELLGPTVELLERADRELRRYLMDQPLMLSMREQAARLRAVMGEKV